MPELALRCIESWHKHMPDWDYKLWDEDALIVVQSPLTPGDGTFESVLKGMSEYAYEAYVAQKYAFVSDYVRLWALEKYGGVYMDVDFEVYKPYDSLCEYRAFAGFEGSKHSPVMMGVCASVCHGLWVREQLENYQGRHFTNADGSLDLTTNVTFISAKMREKGFIQNGKEQEYKDLHVFPVDYFSPRQTTGEYIRTENTYCEHKGLCSWSGSAKGWKGRIKAVIGQKNMTQLIKLKRKIVG